MEDTKVIIGPVVINYPAVWKPRKQLTGDKVKFEVDVLINKKTQKDVYQDVMKAIRAAWVVGKDKLFNGKKPNEIPKFFNPVRDGDKERTSEEYVGHWFLKCKSDSPPGVVDKNRKPIIDESEIYSGAICYVSVNFYAYNQGGGKGIAVGLNNILKLKDGKRLSGRPSAEQEFSELEIETEDSDFDLSEDDDIINFTG